MTDGEIMGGKQKQPQSEYGMVDERKLAGKTPRRVNMPPIPTQDQILNKVAKAFKVKLEGMGTVTAGEYVEALEAMTERTERVLEHMAETYSPEKIYGENAGKKLAGTPKFPKSDIKVLTKKQLMQALAERAEILSIAESLEGMGLRKVCEDLVSRVKDAKNVSKMEYESFLNRFIAGEERIEAILKDITLDKGERAGINALLKRKDNLGILEMGRNFNAVKGFNYPTAGIKDWALKKADWLARVNLADALGGAKWALKFSFVDSSAKLGEEVAKQYEKKHAKFTRKISLLNIGKVAVAAAVVLGAGYLFRCVGGFFIGSDKGEEGSRSSVKKKKRTPVSPAEIELYKNPLFRAKDKTGTPKFVAIAKHMTAMKLSEEAQVKVAKILNKLPGQFVRGMDLRESVELAIILRKLSPGVFIQKLADTVVSIQQYIDSSKTKDFAWTLVKSDKAKKGDVNYWIENPPYKNILTEAWYTRPFPAFVKAGFKPETKFLGVLFSTVRKAKVKKGKAMVPLTFAEQNELAGSLATYYFSTKKKKIPETYQKDLEVILKLRAKGFRMGKVVAILAKLDSIYKPEHRDRVFNSMLPRLAPDMKEGALVVALEAPAVKNPKLAAKHWESAQGIQRQQFLTLTEQGFKKPKAEEIVSNLQAVYKPEHLDSVFKIILPKLKPGMKEEARVVAIEASAVKNPKLAVTGWKPLQATLRRYNLSLIEQGFKKPKAEEIVSNLQAVYKPEHLDSVFKIILPKLKPGMSEGEFRITIEAPAFRNRSMGNKHWVSSIDSRLSFLLEKNAKIISKTLRENSQVYYEKSIGIVLALSKLWQKEYGQFTAKEFKVLHPQIASLSRSDSLAHLTPAELAKILIVISSSVKPKTINIGSGKNRKRVTPREEVLRHLENKFTGQKPTVAAILAEMVSYLEANPEYTF